MAPSSIISVIEKDITHLVVDAMEAYRRMGFNAAGTIHRDLGDGLEFDDIQMQKTIRPAIADRQA